jgi:hypothetical protein
MNVLFTQQWNVERDKEDEYLAFITEQYNPKITSLGLKIVGGYYVEIGTGPTTVAVFSADNISQINEIALSEEYRQITNKLNFYINSRSTALGFSTGRVSQEPYTIQEGVWKWNHYYNVRPNKKNDYKHTLGQIVTVIEKLDFVELTQEWHMLYGGRGDYLLEMTFKDPIDVARLLNNQQFRNLEKLIKKELIVNYSSRLLRSTERFDKPRWVTL